jgi:murein DD-endopeptidase MepM/ murein hydrolase activator NlpD
MSLAQIQATTAGVSDRPVQRDEAAMRRMAQQFEAVLLNQLTASLNPADKEEEEGLFTNSGGLGLSRQMFSEQFAKTMAESGGIGLADMIVSQVNRTKGAVKSREGLRALTASREIRAEPKAINSARADVKPNDSDQVVVPITSTKDSITFGPTPASGSGSQAFDPSGSGSAAHATRPRRVHEIAFEANVPKTTGAAKATDISTSTGPARLTSRVALHAPVSGAIRSTFGPRIDPINGRHRFHKGIDIAATRGTPIEAAATGRVVFAGRNKGYGNMVMIEHADGRRSLYAHAERLFVKAGDMVSAGQTIAAVGSTGHSTGPHLHFEVREGNRAVNPLTALANDFTLTRR